VGVAAARGGVPVAGGQAGGEPVAAAVGVPARPIRLRQRVHPADGAPRPRHAPVADDHRHPVRLHQLLRGAVRAARAQGDRPARCRVRLRLDRRSIARSPVTCPQSNPTAVMTDLLSRLLCAVMSSVEYQPSTVALASILVARNKADLDELRAILGPSWAQLDTVSIQTQPKSTLSQIKDVGGKAQ
jgi:hypothetical protein